MKKVRQNRQTVLFEVLADTGETIEDTSGHSDTEQTDGTSEVLTESGETVEDSSGHSDTKQRDGTV